MASAKTIASRAMVAMCAPVRMFDTETPMNTSAPGSAPGRFPA